MSFLQIIFQTDILIVLFHLLFRPILAESIQNAHKFVECTFDSGKRFTLEVMTEWAPIGAVHFLELVEDGVYNDVALFRCQKNITVQFGVPGDPEKHRKWSKKCCLQDDPKLPMFKQSHWPKGVFSYAGGGKNSRGNQIFVTVSENIPGLGGELWETPFARITEGMDYWLSEVNYDYGDGPPRGKGPDQGTLMRVGNTYIRNNFPKMTFIEKCEIKSDLLPVKRDSLTQLQDSIREKEKMIVDRIHQTEKRLSRHPLWGICFILGVCFMVAFCACVDAKVILGRKDSSKQI